MLRAKILFLITITIFLAIGSIHAQNLNYVGSTLWSGIWDFKVGGDYAYCAFMNGLKIINIADSSQPVLVSELYLQGSGYGIDIVGDYVYIADGVSGLKIINIIDLANPVLTGEYDTADYPCGQVASPDRGKRRVRRPDATVKFD